MPSGSLAAIDRSFPFACDECSVVGESPSVMRGQAATAPTTIAMNDSGDATRWPRSHGGRRDWSSLQLVSGSLRPCWYRRRRIRRPARMCRRTAGSAGWADPTTHPSPIDDLVIIGSGCRRPKSRPVSVLRSWGVPRTPSPVAQRVRCRHRTSRWSLHWSRDAGGIRSRQGCTRLRYPPHPVARSRTG